MQKNQKPRTIYEDDEIIVVNKPSGMLTIPDRYDKSLVSLYETFNAKYGKIFIVHRLDRDTSGIVLMAKNATSHRHISLQFQHNTASKLYHVLVHGILEQDNLDIDIPIAANPRKKGEMIPTARGKESLTQLKVLERFRNATFIECNLVTGRQHQLRVHCAAIGHPLLVDPIYGANSEFKLSDIKRRYNLKKNTEEIPLLARLSMHAYSLTIEHITLAKHITFTAEEPKDFMAALQVLRKYAAVR
ncbi:MAG: pseudouridine synthase [Ignavibacteria bacterium]|nr:pseudouridine synthase [Ignavibacteria bacterium]